MLSRTKQIIDECCPAPPPPASRVCLPWAPPPSPRLWPHHPGLRSSLSLPDSGPQSPAPGLTGKDPHPLADPDTWGPSWSAAAGTPRVRVKGVHRPYEEAAGWRGEVSRTVCERMSGVVGSGLVLGPCPHPGQLARGFPMAVPAPSCPQMYTPGQPVGNGPDVSCISRGGWKT